VHGEGASRLAEREDADTRQNKQNQVYCTHARICITSPLPLPVLTVPVVLLLLPELAANSTPEERTAEYLDIASSLLLGKRSSA
jgi:hypothetical protein